MHADPATPATPPPPAEAPAPNSTPFVVAHSDLVAAYRSWEHDERNGRNMAAEEVYGLPLDEAAERLATELVRRLEAVGSPAAWTAPACLTDLYAFGEMFAARAAAQLATPVAELLAARVDDATHSPEIGADDLAAIKDALGQLLSGWTLSVIQSVRENGADVANALLIADEIFTGDVVDMTRLVRGLALQSAIAACGPNAGAEELIAAARPIERRLFAYIGDGAAGLRRQDTGEVA